MTKNTKKNPIPLWKRIRFKLIFAFLIPVVFIIVLGFVSYQKATTQIIATYRDSVDQTVSMMNQYLTLSFDTVQSNYKGYMNEDTLKQYLNGLYDNDATTLYNTPNTYEDTFIKAVTTDALLSNIYVLSDKERTISTTKTKETGLLSAYLESSQGQILSADRAKYYLFGNQSEVDAKLGTDSSKYSVRLARYFSNAPAILIIDFKPSVLDTSLSSLDGGEGSLVGFVTCDGNEYLSSRSDTAAENTFVGKSYVDEAFASEEDNGSSYVEEAGDEYLFLYSKIGARNAMICALIPQANIIGQTAEIKNVSLILVVAASAVAILLGSLLAGQYGGSIYYFIRRLKKVSDGDLTIEVHSKRNDEFQLLADGICDMIAHMKKLVSGLKDVNEELSRAATDMSAASSHFLATSQDIQKADEELFSMLKDLRKKVAKQHSLPPFVVFQDPSLEDMSIQYPVTLDEMQNISGVGVGKAKKFGAEFIKLIRAYVEEKEIIRPQDMVVKSVGNKSGNKIFIIQSIDRKMDFEDIARAKNLDFDELLTEIEGIVNSGTRLDISYYIDEFMDEDKAEDIYLYFKEDAESDSLDDAVEELGGDYTEEEIRLVRIKFMCEQGN